MLLIVVAANALPGSEQDCTAADRACPRRGNCKSCGKSQLLRTDVPCYSACIQQGMYCREEREGVWCTKAQNCDQLTCDNRTICKESELGPKCEVNVFPSCVGVSCPEGTRCVELRVPARNLSVGQCLKEEISDSYPTYDQYTCTSGFKVCNEDTTCIDSYQDGNFLTIVCAPTGCSDEESPCPGFLLCIEAPEQLQDSFKSVCVAPTQFEFGNDSCNQFDKGCSPGLACHDFIFEGQHIGTDCGPSGTAFTATTCDELECPASILECYQRSIDGRGSLAQCAFKHTVDMVAEEIKSLQDEQAAI